VGKQPKTDLSDIAASIYAPLIAAQLDLERARKSSIEGRALAVAQLSAGLLTIFAAITTAVRGSSSAVRPLPQPSLVCFLVATVLFLIAVICGVIAYSSGSTVRSYAGIPDTAINKEEEDSIATWVANWKETNLVKTSLGVAKTQQKSLVEARIENNHKRNFAIAAASCEVAGVVALAAAAAFLL
jgi:hypothetical protein